MHPQTLQEYIKYCTIRDNALNSNTIDLSQYSWFFPSCLLPLANFLKDNINSMNYIPPSDSVAKYIDTITNRSYLRNSTYIPILNLPKKHSLLRELTKKLEEFHNKGVDYGGRDAFNYLIGELIDNIYEHSNFNNASVMAQRYESKGFVEISIYDDGISIPACFEKHGLSFSHDCYAIVDAINGLSTKGDGRGYGLGSTANLYVNGIGAELMIVSRNGALYKKADDEMLYNLTGSHKLNGTLITIRVPYPAPKVNIFKYIGG